MISIPDFLVETKAVFLDKSSLLIKEIHLEKESAAYNACQLLLNDKKVLFRTAKVTPTKIGQFVTLWKRIENGTIAPFDTTDTIDMVIIETKTNTHSGLFIFPVSVLIEQAIFSSEKKEGKRAFRVYPPWDKTISKQAQKSQQWQLNYFVNLADSNTYKIYLPV
jgi:hypothetical protein